MPNRSMPSNLMLPDLTVAAFGSRPVIESAVTDFPEPDSPTRPRISPSKTFRSAPRTASTDFPSWLKSRRRPFISKSGSLLIVSCVG